MAVYLLLSSATCIWRVLRDHYLLKPCDPAEVIRLLEPLRLGGQDAVEG
jgi:hypothetical protein